MINDIHLSHAKENGVLRGAFSLVELVMVVVILGIISAIAIPRMATAVGDSQIKGLKSSVTAVRAAIEHYCAEHGEYPGLHPVSRLPDGDLFVRQLVEYTNKAGRPNPAPAGYPYGPYLRRPFPVNPVNDLDKVLSAVGLPAAEDDPTGGWHTDPRTGRFGILAKAVELKALGASNADVKFLQDR